MIEPKKGEYWRASIAGDTVTVYLFLIVAAVKQNRRWYYLANKVDACTKTIMIGPEAHWFDSNGEEVDPDYDAFTLRYKTKMKPMVL
jgi:hypothetical protein